MNAIVEKESPHISQSKSVATFLPLVGLMEDLYVFGFYK